ncbi:MAG TPA: DUF559 domain-containing protein, partial [Terriglobales bacterium]|nr:DUF559 domain-containing protein [Terriglobales bacterium]
QGYRVTPQVRVGAYSVDLVVEGDNDARLAIECDGDRHQGPEQWAYEVRRQRVLERAGWTFWRCFAATFVRRRAEVLEDLRYALAANGIEPLGAQAAQVRAHTQLWRVKKPVEARTVVVHAAAIQWGVPASERKPQDHGLAHPEAPRAEPGFEPSGQ